MKRTSQDAGITKAGVAWGFSEAERREARLRAAKDRLNAATAKLMAGDRAAAPEAEAAQREVDRIHGEINAATDGPQPSGAPR